MSNLFHHVTLCSAALALSALSTTVSAERLQPMDIFKLESSRDPQISPNGDHVVYVRTGADIMTDGKYDTLWAVDADGANHRPLTTASPHYGSPRWSPSGDSIAYIAIGASGIEIRVRQMDKGDETIAAVLDQYPAGLAWSSDGSQLAFIMVKPTPEASIADMPAAPEGAEWAEPAYVTQQFVYRLNGEGYLEPGEQHLYVVSAEGGEPRDVAMVAPRETRWGPMAFGWDPSGESIVFSSMRDSVRLDRSEDTDIYEVILASGEVRQITNHVGPDDEPKVSPDGKYIAYMAADDRYRSSRLTQRDVAKAQRGQTKLYLMDRDGGNRRVLTSDLDRDIAGFEWDANGEGLFALYDDRGSPTLSYVALNGDLDVLTDKLAAAGFISAYTRGASFSVANDGRYAFTTAGADYAGEIATGKHGEVGVKRITDLNDDVLGERELGRLEEINYKSKGGVPVQGWLIYPPDFDPSKKYPLIVELHGWPAAYGPRFDVEKQLMASAGYIVLYMNYRGSSGYGKAFQNGGFRGSLDDAFSDIMAGVDAALAKGNVDEERLYIAGGSGGGVLTAWSITRTDRFHAAAVLYPIIDWASWALTGDTLGSQTMTFTFSGAPWEATKDYNARSMMAHMANVKTPTIVMIGTEDYVTPENQAEQFYRALKWVGVGAAFVRVPGEGHGIGRTPSHWISKVLHQIGWFEKYK